VADVNQALSFGLLLQQLSIEERVLVACSVAAARSEDTAFTAAEALLIFDRVWVPRPGNIHDRLAALERQHFVRRAARKMYWGITPQGREVVRARLQRVDSAAIEVELRGTFGSEFAHVRHTLVPPTFAPIKWLKPIVRLTDEFPFERNVFLMTRFPLDRADTQYLDPIRDLIPVIQAALAAHGLFLHVASKRQLDDDVLGNVAAHMWACNYGIGILEDRIQRGLNYNVITELGAMLMTGRRCALLKDKTAPNLPTDLVGQIYKSIDVDNAQQIETVIHRWTSVDLGFGACATCKNFG
jgi:hypothetical protein